MLSLPMASQKNDGHLQIQQQIKEDTEEMALLQATKLDLLRRKEKVREVLHQSDQECDHSSLDPGIQEIHRRVLPLVREIHQLELRKCEILHQQHLQNLQKEVDDIFTALASATLTESRGLLTQWFKQLECLQGSGADAQICQQPKYSSHVKSDKLIEKLQFTMFHRGLSVSVILTASTDLQTESSTSLPDDCVKTTSSVFINGLKDKAWSLLKDKQSVESFIQFAVGVLDEDVIPYATNVT